MSYHEQRVIVRDLMQEIDFDRDTRDMQFSDEDFEIIEELAREYPGGSSLEDGADEWENANV